MTNQQRLIANYRRNLARHHQNDGRSAYYFSTSKVPRYAFHIDRLNGFIESMKEAVKSNCVPLYVTAWCKANHLVVE